MKKYIYLFSILIDDVDKKPSCKTYYADSLDEAIDQLAEAFPKSVITNCYREEMKK